MFREPADIVIDLRRNVTPEPFLRGLLGHGYAETMRASPLVGRLRHMKEALDTGEDTFERKLRYLFWGSSVAATCLPENGQTPWRYSVPRDRAPAR